MMNEEIRAIAERCSQPGPGLSQSELFQLRPYIEDFYNPDWLKNRLDYYEEWAENNSEGGATFHFVIPMVPPAKRRLGDILVGNKLISEHQLAEALKKQRID